MARLEGPDRVSWLVRLAYWFSRRAVGKVTTPIQIHAHNPVLLRAMGWMELGQKKASELESTVKMLASVRTSMRVGCLF